jgi:excisionase family DNA binding protein
MAGEGMKIFLEVDGMLTEVFTPMFASYHLKYSRRTIQQWIDEGKLIAYKVRGQWWIPKHEINRIRWRDTEPPYMSI